MNAMLVKCRCRNCDGHIEFDQSAAGQGATCPHCGMDTVLYIPSPPKMQPAPSPKKRRLLLKAGAIALAVVLLLWLLRLVARSEPALQVVAALGGALPGLVVLIAVGFVVLLWILFPVFVYLAIGRFEALLRQIERNTRQ